jgi:hypothetical protein
MIIILIFFFSPLIFLILSSYPQGEVSIMPQLVAFLALFSTLMAFPAFHFGNNEVGSSNFMCYDLNDLGDICVPLSITSPLYWQALPSTSHKDDEWAVFVKVAAVFGVLAGGLGFLAFGLLASGSCFALTSKRLKQVVLCQITSALFSMLTMLAAKADPCQYYTYVQSGIEYYTNSTDDYQNQGYNYASAGCTKEQTRLDTGAICMIFASLLHLVGCVVTNEYQRLAEAEKEALLLAIPATKNEQLALITGQAVGEEQPLPAGANDDDVVVMVSGECDA